MTGKREPTTSIEDPSLEVEGQANVRMNNRWNEDEDSLHGRNAATVSVSKKTTGNSNKMP